jgi:hypothetical protein
LSWSPDTAVVLVVFSDRCILRFLRMKPIQTRMPIIIAADGTAMPMPILAPVFNPSAEGGFVGVVKSVIVLAYWGVRDHTVPVSIVDG